MQSRKSDPGSLASKIREARKIIGVNQSEFAKEVGVVQAAVSKWELGKSRPTPEALIRIARLVQGRPEAVFFWNEAGVPSTLQTTVEKESPAACEPEVCLDWSQMNMLQRIEWDPDLMTWVIEMIEGGLARKGGRPAPDKYAQAIVVCYEVCHRTGNRDADMVERLLKIA